MTDVTCYRQIGNVYKPSVALSLSHELQGRGILTFNESYLGCSLVGLIRFRVEGSDCSTARKHDSSK